MKQISHASVYSTATNYRHDIATGNDFRLVTDEPPTAGGQGAGPAPYDYILSGLGACTAITLRMYAQHKGWDLGEVSVSLALFKNREGDEVIERELTASGKLDDAQWQRLLEIADKTPVTRTLMNGITINTQWAVD